MILTFSQFLIETGKTKSDREFSVVMIRVPELVALKAQKLAMDIPDDDLNGKGRELDTHITVKFGLHTDKPGPIEKLLVDFEGPLKVKLGKLSLFPVQSPEGKDPWQVLKVDVISPDLVRLNALLTKELPNTSTHPTYHPHLTLAYLKPGVGERYDGGTQLEGEEFEIDSIIFSNQKRHQIEIELTNDDSVAVEVREQLADYAHQAWSGWMKYLFKKSKVNSDGSITIPHKLAERWKRQASTKYIDLPEDEKDSDRNEADRMLSIVKD